MHFAGDRRTAQAYVDVNDDQKRKAVELVYGQCRSETSSNHNAFLHRLSNVRSTHASAMICSMSLLQR